MKLDLQLFLFACARITVQDGPAHVQDGHRVWYRSYSMDPTIALTQDLHILTVAHMVAVPVFAISDARANLKPARNAHDDEARQPLAVVFCGAFSRRFGYRHSLELQPVLWIVVSKAILMMDGGLQKGCAVGGPLKVIVHDPRPVGLPEMLTGADIHLLSMLGPL